ncbi:hypothetical protein LshimejAT787_0702630 [Lyophyllum shimeji]|uniref:Uncharacterized protein n=1 Tax=Lyophyllum shimeji TaxID=47721 RepID=A0A9P3PQJ6_LYOSH|nr:hypothetical protein LshimejAT787_0702630 [Lyophyllum shimeji]
MHTFKPLFAIADLITLRIGLDTAFEIDDHDLLRLGMAWPKLQILELKDRTILSVPKITLAGVFRFVASCPDLEELTLRLNAFGDIAICARLGAIRPHLCLRKFNHCRSSIKDPIQVAAILAFMFPNLSTLSAEHYHGGPNGGLLDFTTADVKEKTYLERREKVEDMMLPLLKCHDTAQSR